MDDDATDPAIPNRRGRRRPRQRWGAGALVAVINGVLVGAGGVYAGTSPIPVPVVAAAAAVLLAGLIVLAHR